MQLPNNGFQGGVRIIAAAPAVFAFLFTLSFSVSTPDPLNF
jgi:hypothetical protein